MAKWGALSLPAAMTSEEICSLRQQVVEKILLLEQQFQAFYELYLRETSRQVEAIDYILTVYTEFEEKRKIQPEIKSENLIQEFKLKSNMLRASNGDLMRHISKLTVTIRRLDDVIKKLSTLGNINVAVGTIINQPLSLLGHCFVELYQYFHVVSRRLCCRCEQLKVNDVEGLKYYRKLVVPSYQHESALMEPINQVKNMTIDIQVK